MTTQFHINRMLMGMKTLIPQSQRKIDMNKKMKLINNIPPERMKLKALHHSILVKAEFFMKLKENHVFSHNFCHRALVWTLTLKGIKK
ncbi:CLUMA_CG009598, isoform A [Clunio marinus]|uniref:CLUMA_CG009598, isoform A n=1 Tax=Clunio marinus TaxID=568069 RepID=A0A1J1ICK5_9DIPT|nr:CLUMA_CG009598, isoform A [Clunio marinus]